MADGSNTGLSPRRPGVQFPKLNHRFLLLLNPTRSSFPNPTRPLYTALKIRTDNMPLGFRKWRVCLCDNMTSGVYVYVRCIQRRHTRG